MYDENENCEKKTLDDDMSPTLAGELERQLRTQVGYEEQTDKIFYDKREEDKKDDSKSMFPLVAVQVRHQEPGNYTHLILLPRNYSLIAKSGTRFQIWRSRPLHLFC